MAGTSAPSRPASTSAAPAAAAAAACATVVTGASSSIPAEPPQESDITHRAWHDSYVPVLFLIAIVVVLVGIFFAATGRGGEMSYEPADHAPLDLGPVSAADVALLRPPTAMWGYNMQVTDEALDQIARAMRDRDVTIAYLQDQLAGYEHSGSYAAPPGAYSHQDLEAAGASGFPEAPGAPTHPDALEPSGDLESAENPEAWKASEAWGAPENPEAWEAPENPEAWEAPENPEASRSPHDPEAAQSPEEPEPLEIPGMHEPLETPEPLIAGPPAAAAAAEAATAPGPPRTTMTLKASGSKQPEPHEVTQPSHALQDPGDADDATEPSAIFRHDDEESGEPTQPSASLAPNEAPGPQGAFDTHGWWAEQKEAAREEQAGHQASGEKGDDSVAAAEEQGW